MEWYWILLILLGILICFMAVGLPVVFAFFASNLIGAFIFMGNGDSAGLHHEEYDFNDEAIPVGSSYWAKIAERSMPAS